MKTHLYIIFLMVLGALNAQVVAPYPKTVKGNWEKWQDNVPISGHVRVGLMAENSRDSFNPKRFFVLLPENTTTDLCVEISSKDGRYSANLNYPTKSKPAGKYEFELPTNFAKQLSNLKKSDVCILASLSTDCESKPTAFLISGWEIEKNVKHFDILLNTNGSTKVTVVDKNEEEIEYPCEKLPFPVVGFNNKCRIPVEKMQEKNITTVVVTTSSGTGVQSFEHYQFPIQFVKEK